MKVISLFKILFKKLIFKFAVKYFYLNSIIDFYKHAKSQKQYSNRIKLIFNSNSINHYKKICIFVAYTKKLSLSTKLYINSLNEIKYGVVLVNNLSTANEDLEYLSKNSILCFNRINLGQDIGAYKDIFLYLSKNGYLENLDFLCFANDSVQFIPGKYENNFQNTILKFEKTNSDGLFSHFSNQVEPHFQSFFSIIRKNIFCEPEYKSFWENYIPLSNREHAIHSGEILLSKKFYNKIKNPTIIYGKNKFTEYLNKSKKEESISLLNFQILDFIPSFSRTFIELETLKLIPFFSRTSKYQNYKWFLNNIFKKKIIISNFKNEKLMDYFFMLIEANNPSQVGAFIYPLFLQCPLLKNNLVLSGSFKINQTLRLYKLCLDKSMNLNNPEQIEIYKELLKEYSFLINNKENSDTFKKNFLKGVQFGINEGFKYTFH